MEYRLRRHDGEYRWLSDHGVPRYDSDRNFLGYIGSCVDLTERKLAEAEALRQRAELTHVARLSTMGALASSLAHELNQPLSAILSNAQAGSRFLAATPPDLAEVRGALADIAQDTKRAGEVIRQLRALVKRDETHLQPLNLNGVITEVVQLVHSDMLIRNASIALELDRALPLVSGDTVQLQQVLLNLLLNAFDSMAEVPEGRRTAVLRTRRWDASSIRVEVCDCGTGISPERLVNLFERFRSSKRDGLGLGLSISHSIVEAHRGRLWAENNHDRGATFYFTLPVQEAELDLH
jgi:two-component system sensor kinase FixL